MRLDQEPKDGEDDHDHDCFVAGSHAERNPCVYLPFLKPPYLKASQAYPGWPHNGEAR